MSGRSLLSIFGWVVKCEREIIETESAGERRGGGRRDIPKVAILRSSRLTRPTRLGIPIMSFRGFDILVYSRSLKPHFRLRRFDSTHKTVGNILAGIELHRLTPNLVSRWRP